MTEAELVVSSVVMQTPTASNNHATALDMSLTTANTSGTATIVVTAAAAAASCATSSSAPSPSVVASSIPPHKTPPRNNYANPNTPIASIKRPRSSIDPNNNNSAAKATSTTSTSTPKRSSLSSNSQTQTMMSTTPTPASSQRHLYSNTKNNSHSSSTTAAALSPLHPPKAFTRDSKTMNNTGGAAGDFGEATSAEMIFSPVLYWEQGQHQHPEDDNDAPLLPIAEEVRGLDDDERPNALVVVDDPDAVSTSHDNSCCSHSIADDSLSVSEMDVDDEFNPWQFIKSLPPYAHVLHMTPPVTLPPKDPMYDLTLVLDLDETLVHCSVEPTDDADFLFPVLFHGMEYQVYVRLRPYLDEFMQRIASLKMEVIVFTASQKVYADELLNRIDPENKFFHYRLFRESCLPVEGNFLKDLNVLGRDLRKTILVDNSPHAFGYQIDNGVPIESWFDAPNDRELLKLERFVRQLVGVSDVRTLCRRKFHLAERVRAAPDYHTHTTSESETSHNNNNSSTTTSATRCGGE